MAIVRKRNEVLRVKDDLVKHYLSIGYDVIDEGGNILQKTIPTDMTQLKGEYAKLTAQVEELKAKLAEAEDKIKELEAKSKETEAKPRRTRKSDVE